MVSQEQVEPTPIANPSRPDAQPVSSSAASTTTIDSSQKISLLESPVTHDRWSTETQHQLLNIGVFKEQQSQAKHWRELKKDLKILVSKIRSQEISHKFELEVKIIGPTNAGQECIPGLEKL